MAASPSESAGSHTQRDTDSRARAAIYAPAHSHDEDSGEISAGKQLRVEGSTDEVKLLTFKGVFNSWDELDAAFKRYAL